MSWISEQLLGKLNADLVLDKMLTLSTQMSQIEIRTIYERFGKQFVAMGLHKELGTLDSGLASMRIGLCRQRIKDSSLTAYRTISRAMEEISSFPWEKVMNVFGTQKKHYQELKAKVEADPYFGFSEDSSRYGAILYADLYYLSKKLIIEHLGDRHLERYTCRAKPTDYALCEALYKEYKTRADALVSAKAKKLFEVDEEAG